MAEEIEKRRYIVDMAENHQQNGNEMKRAKLNKQSVIQLTDLNDDCLREICLTLNLKGLNNISMINMRLMTLAIYAFKRNYTETVIKFHPFAINRNLYNNFIHCLHTFGENIKKLDIGFFTEHRFHARNQQIIHIINTKCKNIVELTLDRVQSDLIQIESFHHLQKLKITNSFLHKSIVNLIQSAPNLSSLEFDTVENVFDSALVEHHIPLLKHFSTYNQVITDCELTNLKNFRRFLNVNQQVISLGIGSREMEMLIHYKEVQHQFYKTIHRRPPPTEEPNFYDYLFPFEAIYFGNLKCLSLGIGYSNEFLNCLRERRLLFDNLLFNELKLYIADLPMNVYDFVAQCSFIQKLHLYVTQQLNKITVANIILNLPELREVELYLLYDDDLEFMASHMPHSIAMIIKYCRNPIEKVTVHYEIQQPICNTDENYQQNMAKRLKPLIMATCSEHLPNDWQANCKTQNIQIDHYSRNAFVLSNILVKTK